MSEKHARRRSLIGLFLLGTVAGGMFLGTANAHIVTGVNHTWAHIRGKTDPLYGTLYFRKSESFSILNGATVLGQVACPGNALATGGGAYTNFAGMTIEASYPTDGSSAGNAGYSHWGAWVRNQSGSTANFSVYVLCQYAAFFDANYAAGSSPVRGADSR